MIKTTQHEIIDKILEQSLLEIKNIVQNAPETLNDTFTKESFHKLKNNIFKDYDVAKPFASTMILERYLERIDDGSLEMNEHLLRILRKRGVRSLSGVTVISLLTKFFGCPGKCIYCPTFEGLPKSYIPNEPAVMRAQLNDFDPILQIHNRLRALEVTGHKIEKNDVRIIGGTWSFYPKKYRDDFIRGIYNAFNSYTEMKDFIESTDLSTDRFASFKIREGYKVYESSDLAEAKKNNETTKCRVIGMAIETRPDWITWEELLSFREYGITRVEIGYQTTFDEINELNKRGHGNAESQLATKMLKDTGFKVVAHMMPNLYGSTPDMDRASMKEIFDNQKFRPDELKIYPMVVTDMAELTDLWKEGKFEAYDDETLINLMKDIEMLVPEYVRINRTYRDIPASEILHGSTLSNLRQIVENKLKEEGRTLVDIRSREIKNKGNDPHKAVLHTVEYDASDGKEIFLTYEDPDDRTIFSLLRLRIPSSFFESEDSEYQINLKKNFPELNGAALIREIHTFGDQLSIGQEGNTFGQHIGFGKKLISEAEKIAKAHGANKVAVIAGVGVRPYYIKRGYHLEGEYMVKNI